MTQYKYVIFIIQNEYRSKALPKGSAFFDECGMVILVINGNCQDTKALLSSEKSHEKEKQEVGEKQKISGDAAASIRYLLRLPPVESVAQELKDLGVPEPEQTNMMALQARLYSKAMSGDLKSYETLMKMGGYEAPSGRTSGQEEKIPTSGVNGPEDVFIYLPKIEEEPLKSGSSIESDQPKTGG